jgi:pilus assembly protein FimV
MIITCEECSTSFNLDDKFLKPSGSKVRCSKCKHVFTAFPGTVSVEKETPPVDVPADESEAATGAETTPDVAMTQETDSAVADEQVQEEAGVDEEQPEGLDFDMDVSPEEAAAEGTEEAGLEELDLTGLGATMDMDAAPEAGEEADVEEVDLSTLDEELDVAAGPETEDAASEDMLEDLDLDLDMDAEPVAEEGADAEEMDLSSLDEALDIDAEPAEEVVAETEDAASEDMLEDLDLDMDAESEAEKETEADDLDMSDVKFELGDDDADVPVGDSELELGLEMESGEGEDDLDLEGFEQTLEMDSPPDAGTGEDIEDLDLELELEMEGDDQSGAEPGEVDTTAKDAEEEIEDLDFELDMEFESDEDIDGAELELESDETEDLDMSDIEQMLEVKDGDILGEEMAGADLDGEAETEVEKWKDTPGQKGPAGDTAEIDLSDIDLDAEAAEDVEIEDQELDFDIDEETIKSAAAIAAGKTVPEEPEELDISHFEDMEVEEESSSGVLSEGDIELEFEVEGDSTDGIGGEATSDVADPTQQLATIAMDADTNVLKKAEAADAKKPKKKKEKKVKKTKPVGKSGAGKPALIVLLLLVLAFGAVVVLDRYVGIEIPYVTEYVKKVPYVNQLMQPDMKKTGEITTSNISSKFVDNENNGKLFVITGMVKNEFPESRRFIQLTGRLFAGGKALVKEETVYCGNTMTDVQLALMDLADINKKLSNRFGDNKSNVMVKAGQQLPFMVVFSDFPQDLEEFTIEVVGSSPVQQ